MNGGVAIQVVPIVAHIFAYSLFVILVGVCARIAGCRWPVLRAPANRMIVIFGVFAAASLYLLMSHRAESCANASLEVWRPSACVYPWIKPPPPLEVDRTWPLEGRFLARGPDGGGARTSPL